MATKKTTKKAKELKEEIKKEEQNNKDEQTSLLSILELIAIIIAVVIILIFFKHTVVWNTVVLLLMLGALIFVHELGHFIMAKKFGIHVYEFAIGMGPLVLSFRRKNDPTLYTLRAFPLGGYNAIAGESYDDDENLPKEAKLCYKPKWQRFLVLVAGVTMNFITALVLLFVIGITQGTSNQDAVIGKVDPNTPAEVAGLVPGDKIIKLNGHKVDSWYYLQIVSVLKHDNNFVYEVQHVDGSVDTYTIVPKDVIQDNDGHTYEITEENTKEKIIEDNHLNKNEYAETKVIGIYGDSEVHHGIKSALSYTFKRFWTIVRSMGLILKSLFTGELSLNSLSGPVGMYSVVKSAAKVGFINIIYLTAYLSINLGVMNILPIPAVDGGHVLFIFIELITGRRVNEKVENAFHLVGFVLLFALMIYISFKDVLRLFG